MISVDSPEAELDDMEVAEAGRKLREEGLPFLLTQLEKLEVLPLDSFSISQVLYFIVYHIFIYQLRIT